jgi:zinc protease
MTRRITSALRAFLPLLVLGSLVPAPVASAQTAVETPPPPSAPRPVKLPTPAETTLDNGLRVIVVESHKVPLASAQMFIKSGSEVDPPALSGLADVTANLLTKGTSTRSATEIAQAIEALGGSLASGSGWDRSTAAVEVMSNRFGAAMEILAEVVLRPAFKDDELERLRAQTLDELSVTFSQPGPLARFTAARVVFGDAPYGHPAGGTPESIERIKRDDVVKLHATYYRPDNAILVVGGDVKASDVFAMAKTLFGQWAKPATALPVTPPSPAAAGATARVVVVDKPDAGQAAVYVSRLGIKRDAASYYPGIVTNAVLSGYSGRLNQEIRIKRGLSYGAGSALDARRDFGPFVATAQTKNESGAEVASLLLAEVTRLAAEPVSVQELVPRKASLAGDFARSLETGNGLAGQVAALALYGLPLNQLESNIAKIEAVTPADVQKFAQGHLVASSVNVVVVGNAKAFVDDLRKRFPNVEVIPIAELDLNSASLKAAPK